MSVQERTVVNAEEELAKRKRKVLGIFPVRDQGARSASGSSTPNAGPAIDAAGGVVAPRRGSVDEYDEDADEEPPREEGDIGDLGSPTSEAAPAITNPRKDQPEEDRKEEEAVKAIPKTAGFDFDAIGRELGKDINVDKLKHESRPSPITTVPSDLLERSGSAPPPIAIEVNDAPPETRQPTRLARSASYAPPIRTQEEEDDDAGDITRSTSQIAVTDMPSWDRPASITPPTSTISPAAADLKVPSFGGDWNAWSTPAASSTTSTSLPLRPAPPARPHPAEWMSNPFAAPESASTASGQNGNSNFFSSWSRKSKAQDDDATQNPW